MNNLSTNSQLINIYCDESCHLENDGIDIMALGAISCPAEETNRISNSIRELKKRHGLSRSFEAKWTKISNGKLLFYLDIISLFYNEECLRFRGVLVKEKSKLNHIKFNQSHDDWYYKMYFIMLRHMLNPPNKYRVYIDIKDTKGGARTKKLQHVLANNIHDYDLSTISRVQQIQSHESEIMQITDMLIGSLTYFNRNLEGNTAKTDIITFLQNKFGNNTLSKTSSFNAIKFNVLHWQSDEINK